MVALTAWPTLATRATEEKWEKMVPHLVRGNGLWSQARNYGDYGVVLADSSGMNIQVGTLEAMLRGFECELPSRVRIGIEPAESSTARKDAVALVWRMSGTGPEATATVSLEIIKGTAGAANGPQNASSDSEERVVLAYVNVKAQAVTITQADITDMRLVPFSQCWCDQKLSTFAVGVGANGSGISPFINAGNVNFPGSYADFTIDGRYVDVAWRQLVEFFGMASPDYYITPPPGLLPLREGVIGAGSSQNDGAYVQYIASDGKFSMRRSAVNGGSGQLIVPKPATWESFSARYRWR